VNIDFKAIFLNSRRPTPFQWWRAFVCSIVGWSIAIVAFCHSPNQDHFGAITLAGDEQWYGNYLLSEQQILDTDIFYYGVGRSITNLLKADVVFVGTSRVLFGIDWRAVDDFERRRGIKFFNLAFAGVLNSKFTQSLIAKWNIHPRAWIVDVYADAANDFQGSFFNPAAVLGFEAQTMAEAGVLEAYANVVARDVRWRFKMALGADGPAVYRSDRTGNWYLDKWPNRLRTDMPKMEPARANCSAPTEEAGAARNFAALLKAPIVVTQIPSSFGCYRRAQRIASAIEAPLFAPDPADFSSTDGGSHLDQVSSARYTHEFLDWLEHTLVFRQIAMAKAR
jgi:hypothetical protein